LFASVVLFLQYQAKRLVGKNVSKMTYSVSSGTVGRKSLTQSSINHCCLCGQMQLSCKTRCEGRDPDLRCSQDYSGDKEDSRRSSEEKPWFIWSKSEHQNYQTWYFHSFILHSYD